MKSLVKAVASSKSSVDLLDFGLAMMACWGSNLRYKQDSAEPTVSN